MKTVKELKFSGENQEKLFKLLLSIAKNFSDDDFKLFENQCAAVVDLPSIRAEINAWQTFDTKHKNTPEEFRVKAEFWLRTVFFKLEERDTELLVKRIKFIKKHNEENPSNKMNLMDFLVTAMNVEPPAKIYAFHIKNEGKKVKERNLGGLSLDF